MALKGDWAAWPGYRKIGALRDHLISGGADQTPHTGPDCAVCASVFQTVRPLIGQRPISYTGRGPGFEPKPMEEAERLCRNELREIHAYISGEGPAEPQTAQTAPEPRPSVITVNTDAACQTDAAELIDWIQHRWRKWAHELGSDGRARDQVGLRPALAGAKMLRQGIRPDAVKHALTLHYAPEARRHLGVTDFDPSRFAPRQWVAVQTPSTVRAHSGQHAALPYIVALAQARTPIYLYGPPGTGKTTLAEQLAAELFPDRAPGDRFGMVSMTRGTSPSAFNGRPRIADPGTAAYVHALIANGRVQEALKIAEEAHAAGDVVVSQWTRIYGGGGVFLADELDAGDENLVLLTNAALANRFFANSATAQTTPMHPDFVMVGAGNTNGRGGTAAHNARGKQDDAVMDRYAPGRVEILHDAALEAHLYWKILAA